MPRASSVLKTASLNTASLNAAFRFVSAFALCGVCGTGKCRAQQLGVGARALGMGGAYTAVADDVYAPYWNPAGVATLRGVHAALPDVNARLTGPVSADTLISQFPSSTSSQIAFARRAGTGITQADISGDAAFAVPHFALSFMPFATGQLVPRNASGGIGFRYINFAGMQVPEPGSQADTNAVIAFQTVATFATKTDARTSAGLNLKLTNYQPTNINVRFNGTNLSIPVTTTTGHTTLGVGADAGVLYHFMPGVVVGATLRDFFRPDIRQNGMEVSPTTLTLGAAYRTRNRKLLVAADVANLGHGTSLNLGVEASPLRYLQARAGMYRGRPTLGLGIGPYVNVAYNPDQTLVGVSLGF